jgi:hypothetical protein
MNSVKKVLFHKSSYFYGVRSTEVATFMDLKEYVIKKASVVRSPFFNF